MGWWMFLSFPSCQAPGVLLGCIFGLFCASVGFTCPEGFLWRNQVKVGKNGSRGFELLGFQGESKMSQNHWG